jgi:hypothetical protein
MSETIERLLSSNARSASKNVYAQRLREVFRSNCYAIQIGFDRSLPWLSERGGMF